MKTSSFFNFKPRLLPTIIFITSLLMLLCLSFWQFKRLIWKERLIASINQQGQHDPIMLPEHFALDDLLYRKVKLKGSFVHDQELYLYGGSRQFKGEIGYFVLTPLELENGKLVLINRGWVPERLKSPSLRPATLLKEKVEIFGVVMASEKKATFTYDNQLDKNLWFYIDMAQISQHLKCNLGNFYILAAENKDPKVLPRGKNLTVNIYNNHLVYALTWLMLAIAFIVVYIMYHKSNKVNQ